MKAPNYGHEGLASVLPSVAHTLAPQTFARIRKLPPARAAIVVLADGLGARLLKARGGHAPFLRSHQDQVQTLAAGFPTTTATSMATFGTGLPPGAHGLSGYHVLDPATQTVFNELTWQGGPNARHWQPNTTIFERADAADLRPAMVGPGFFDGSGLTTAALRGAKFYGATSWPERVEAALAAVRSGHRLVYVYWGEIDKAGHQYGVNSWQFGDELEAFDAGLAHLHDARPPGTSLTLTADHGMVDVPKNSRIDIAHRTDLRDGVRHVGGEMRAVHLYCQPGAAADVQGRWTAELGNDGEVLLRDELVDLGWVGPMHDEMVPRFGDVVINVRAPRGFVDSRFMSPRVMDLIGQHGAMTPAELDVPFLHLPAK